MPVGREEDVMGGDGTPGCLNAPSPCRIRGIWVVDGMDRCDWRVRLQV